MTANDGEGAKRWLPGSRSEPTVQPELQGRLCLKRLADDIAHFALVAHSIVSRGDDRFFEDSEDGEILRRAGRNLVTEFWAAVERLPDDVVAAHPEIPFEKIRGMRNRVAHHYEHVDDEYVWAALDGRFREVAESLAQYRETE